MSLSENYVLNPATVARTHSSPARISGGFIERSRDIEIDVYGCNRTLVYQFISRNKRGELPEYSLTILVIDTHNREPLDCKVIPTTKNRSLIEEKALEAFNEFTGQNSFLVAVRKSLK